MASSAYPITSVTYNPSCPETGIGCVEKEYSPLWRGDINAKTLAWSYSLGSILSALFLTLAIISFISLIITLLSPIAYVSPKFALFLFLLFLGLGIEVLLAKNKLK